MNKFLNYDLHKLEIIGWHVLPPIAFIPLVLSLFPVRDAFSFDSDEGINLIKSLLLMHGYPLYSATWSDQPPLLTYLLAGVFKLFGLDVNTGRGLILFFACVLVWAFTQYMLRITNRRATLVGLFLLFLMPYFAQLSVSVMVGLPAVALGTVALLFITLWHQTKKRTWLVLSGAFLALSMLIKLIGGIFAPIIFLGIFIEEYRANKQNGTPWYRLPSVGLFCASFFVLFIAGILFMVGPVNGGQLILNHLSYYRIIASKTIAVSSLTILGVAFLLFSLFWYRTKRWYWLVLAILMLTFVIVAGYIFATLPQNGVEIGNNISDESGDTSYLEQIQEFILFFKKLVLLWLLAVIGAVRVIKSKHVMAYHAVAWATAGFLFICIWRPIWYHHWMLFTIPAAILASMAFNDSEKSLRQLFSAFQHIGFWQGLRNLRYTGWIDILVLVVFVVNWGVMGMGLISDSQKIKASLVQPDGDNKISMELMSHVMAYAPQAQWMITDSPIFAFRANVLTPPGMAVISHKRLWSGELLKEQIGETIEDWQPELILFAGKIDANFLIQRYIKPSYTQVFSENPYKLFVRNDIYFENNH